MKRTRLTKDHHVVRGIRPGLVADFDGELEVYPQAFRVRLEGEGNPPLEEDEKYLSAAWSEFFDGDDTERLRGCLDSIKKYRTMRPNAGLAVCSVGLLEIAGKGSGAKLSVWHEPNSENEAYAAIHGVTANHQENDLLPTRIKEMAVVKVQRVKDLDEELAL